MSAARIKKIVIIGPESTGKSTLCEMLAEHYQTTWVREYAREYLLKHGTNYSYENLLEIAKGQIKLEEEAIKVISNMPKWKPGQVKGKNVKTRMILPITYRLEG